MGELGEYLPVVEMNSVDEAFEPRNHAVLVDTDLPRRIAPAQVAEHVAAEDQTDPVSSQRLIHVDKVVSDFPRICGCSLRSACAHYSIRDFDWADASWLE